MSSDQNAKIAANSNPDTSNKAISNPAMDDYLQAPKKKRKSFVAFGVGPNLSVETISSIQKFFESTYPKLILLKVTSSDELLKLASKNVVLLLIDDELSVRTSTLQAVHHLKQLRKDGPLPTIFFTKDPPSLIAEYQSKLPLWNEVDDYINILDENRHALLSKIKHGIENRNQRRSRRFKANIPVSFQILDSGDHRFKGELMDFSLHGALLSTSDQTHRFSTKDQLVLHLPLSTYVQAKADFFKVSARVRRVLITGDKAGISWEYLSDEKVATITEILTAIVDTGMARAAAAARQRYSKLLEAPEATDSSKSKSSKKI